MNRRPCNRKPNPGDLIEIFRPLIQHWAFYIGDGYVVHLGPCEVTGVGAGGSGSITVDRAFVKERLCDVVGNDDWEVNNLLDHQQKPFDVDVTVKNAKGLVGEHCLRSSNRDYFVIELRYGKAESRQRDQRPKPGDLIEIFRPGYQHWAIYISRGYVVHLGPSCEVAGAGLSSSGSITANRAKVRKEKLRDVAGDDDWRVNNLLDHKYEPLDVDEMVRTAKDLVGEELRYSISALNCEHFVTLLRYGKAESEQVRAVAEALARGLTVADLRKGLFRLITMAFPSSI